jgi:hypothetical protein
MKTSKMIAAIGLVACILSASGAEQIQGAFGIRFGQEFTPSQAVKIRKTKAGDPMYQFVPKAPYEAFTTYYVLTTPTSNSVYCIWAIGPQCEKADAIAQQAVLMKLLREKYGEIEKPELPSEVIERRQRIKNYPREVSCFVGGISSFSNLEIQYLDTRLEELAEKERIEAKAATVDAVGL